MRTWAVAGLLIAVSGCSSLKTTPTGGGLDGAPAPAPAAPAPVTGRRRRPAPAAPAQPAPATPTQPFSACAAGGTASGGATAAGCVGDRCARARAAASGCGRAGEIARCRSSGQTAAPAAAQSPATPPPTASSPAAAPATKAPTLNLADLEQRLRDTRAIGVFTKLSLKNQVDDLLKAFRTLYRDPNKRPPPELRQRYDRTAAQGAHIASGRRSAARGRDRILARGDLEHSRGSRKICKDLDSLRRHHGTAHIHLHIDRHAVDWRTPGSRRTTPRSPRISRRRSPCRACPAIS